MKYLKQALFIWCQLFGKIKKKKKNSFDTVVKFFFFENILQYQHLHWQQHGNMFYCLDCLDCYHSPYVFYLYSVKWGIISDQARKSKKHIILIKGIYFQVIFHIQTFSKKRFECFKKFSLFQFHHQAVPTSKLFLPWAFFLFNSL